MKTFITIAVIAATSAACSSAPPRQSADPQLTSASLGWPRLGQDSARFIRIDLGPDTFAECQRLAPKFPFESAMTYAQDRIQLAALATCLNLQQMRERKLVLVGRADPRGTDAYNARLGMKRAETIKQILIENGIAADRIDIVSEGESAAVGGAGNDATYSYGYDRRVDVIVRGGAHAP
jgi:outer membrane protein OmpA-like peptidoglycan-associated protein